MSFNESLVFYLTIGFAVAVADMLVERSAKSRRSWMSPVAAWVFWPLYLPIVLSSRSSPTTATQRPSIARDDLAIAIEQVERELEGALTGLDGWAENVLKQNAVQLLELRGDLIAQADRIRDMEAILAGERAESTHLDRRPAAIPSSAPASERSERSWQARHDNMMRLDQVCKRARDDLLATLAWIRELVSMIHLAKFTGAPAARAEELVAQIAAAVESISSLSGSNSDSAVPRDVGPPIPIVTQANV